MGFSKPKVVAAPTPEPAPLPVKEVDMTQEIKTNMLSREKQKQGMMSTLLTNRKSYDANTIGKTQSLLNKTLG